MNSFNAFVNHFIQEIIALPVLIRIIEITQGNVRVLMGLMNSRMAYVIVGLV